LLSVYISRLIRFDSIHPATISDREKNFAYFSAPLILAVASFSTAAAKESMTTDLRADARAAIAKAKISHARDDCA
jgi:hypothetical protein